MARSGKVTFLGFAVTDGKKPILPGTPGYDEACKLAMSLLPPNAALQEAKESRTKSPQEDERTKYSRAKLGKLAKAKPKSR